MFLKSMLFVLFCISIQCFGKKTRNGYKNILFIIADDLGWADIGLEDSQVLTPNINKYFENSIVLNQSYAYPFCTPSRSSFLTGVFAEHTGLQHTVIQPEEPVGIPTSFQLLPEIFKQFGYKTHMIGKWHLGFCNDKYTPTYRGFDTFYGFFNAQNDYYNHRLPGLIILGNNTGLDYWNATSEYSVPILDKNDTYSMFSYTERAINILENHNKDNPFFMYFSSQNTHVPLQVPQKYEDLYKNVADENRRKFLGMASVLDESVGNLTQTLDRLGLLDDTIIFFTSDNGGATYGGGRNYPLRGGKMTVFEGGTRVRGFINGKNLKPYVYNGMFHAVDWMPTILHAAVGVPVDIPGIDGMDQWMAVTNNNASPRTSFIYTIDQYGSVGCNLVPTEAIRNGDWKLIMGCVGPFPDYYPIPTYDSDFAQKAYNKHNKYTAVPNIEKQKKNKNIDKTKVYLYNIKDDPYEKNNLAEEFPDIVKNMTVLLNEYKKNTLKPINGPYLLPVPQADPSFWHDTWSPGWC